MKTALEVFEVAFEVGKFIAGAILAGDDHIWRPIADIMPAPLKSRIERVAQDAKTEAELRKVLSPDG